MKCKVAIVSLLVLLFLSAFSQNPRPLFALPLPEGRTYDQAHDSGFIDWSGPVGYVDLNHKDGICPSGCVEQVTRISNGGTVSGAFAPVDVAYFEVMVAFTHNSGAGTAVLNACGSSAAWYLYVGPGSGLPGFVSMSVPVPSGCTSWSLSASGGYVDFRSVDANYVSPPPPVSTNTFTPIPTATFSPTGTMTPSPTETETATPTVTETLAPGVTPSDTPTPSPAGTMSDTPSPTSTTLSTSTFTSTPSQTLPPGITPSETPVPTNTPVLPVWTNTSAPPSSGGGQGGSGGFVLPTATFTPTPFFLPTPTDTPHVTLDTSHMTPNLVETARVMIFGTATPTPTPKPVGGAGKTGSGFPWWLILAGGAAAYTVGKRRQIAQGVSNYRMKIRERKRVEECAAPTPAHGTAEAADKKERVERGINAVQNANAWLAEEKVIEPELRRLHILNAWEQADYWRRFPGGTAEDLTVIEGIGPKVQKVLQENGYRTIADLASADPAKLKGLLQEQKWHFMDPTSWVHQARLAATGNQKGLQALQNELKGGHGPLPQGTEENLMQRLVELEEIAENRRLPTRVLDGVDSVSDVLSIGGNLVYAATSWEAAKKAGDVGDALGIFGGIAQIAKCSKFFGQGFRSVLQNASNIGRGVSFLGKVSGVLSIVTGALGAYGGYTEIRESLQDGQADEKTAVGWLNLIAGVLATGGGIALLIPGAQPIAGIALGISAVLSGAATVIENWGWITSTLQNTVQVWRENFHQVGQIIEKVKRIVRERAADAVERGGQALASGVERAGERLAGLASRTAENGAQGVERATQTAGRAVQAVSQAVSRGIETVGNAAAQGVQRLTQAVSQSVNIVGQTLAKGTERVTSTIASWLKPFNPGLANGVEHTGQSVAQAVSNTAQRISSTLSQAGQEISRVIQRGTQTVSSMVRQAGQAAGNAVAHVGQGIANGVRQAGQAVSSGVQKLTQTASSAVKSWTSSISSWLRRP
ncbi:MAG: hypothetical protein DDG60_06025 [Anaerolineae bacterium]|nr:MAG: hypothetical protein DDG60_06025 [Anaerolineae bacterium]